MRGGLAGTALYKHGVRVLGTPVKAIEATEDRQLFVDKLNEIGAKSPRSIATTSTEDAVAAAEEVGFPVMVRVAYALGGSGSGICRNEADLRRRCDKAFATSPQVLVEEWLGGWKEIEYEVVRDRFDNCITVCNMENFDPLGIHTGESIVVAPSQTLTDSEYHKLRRVALDVIRHLGIVGECNIQYALDPFSEDYRIIEVNARLSRSSALASKATGYPLAFVAAKLALGWSLADIENRITRATKSCFEPALDYCVVKVPRWDLTKFKNVDVRIGSEMKSVGEVMSIGRTFEEALQKALRMTGTGAPGFAGDDEFLGNSFRNLKESLSKPTDRRVFAVYRPWRRAGPSTRSTGSPRSTAGSSQRWPTPWTASRPSARSTATPPPARRRSCRTGTCYSRQSGWASPTPGSASSWAFPRTDVRTLREDLRVRPAVKQIDTLAAEYPAKTNYLYMTYAAQSDDTAPANRGVMVLGSGPTASEAAWSSTGAASTRWRPPASSGATASWSTATRRR
jgi:carbamoyl-phosphate synthase large subunit